METGFFPNIYRSYAATGNLGGENNGGWIEKPEPCWSYNDPHADVMADLNLLMFMYVETGSDHGCFGHSLIFVYPN